LLVQTSQTPEIRRELALFHALNNRESAARAATRDPLDMLLRQLTEDVVYFLSIGHLVKIGHSRHLRDRLKAMGLTSTSLLAIELGGRERERQLHEQFRKDRVTGELFKRSPALLTYIASRDPRVSD
jgi:hypothetical protein